MYFGASAFCLCADVHYTCAAVNTTSRTAAVGLTIVSHSTHWSKSTANLLFIFRGLQSGIWPETCFWLFVIHTHAYLATNPWQVSYYSSLKRITIISSEVGSCCLKDLKDLCPCLCLPECQTQTASDAGQRHSDALSANTRYMNEAAVTVADLQSGPQARCSVTPRGGGEVVTVYVFSLPLGLKRNLVSHRLKDDSWLWFTLSLLTPMA